MARTRKLPTALSLLVAAVLLLDCWILGPGRSAVGDASAVPSTEGVLLWESNALIVPPEHWRGLDVAVIGDATGDDLDDVIAVVSDRLWLYTSRGDGTFACDVDAFRTVEDTPWSIAPDSVSRVAVLHDLDGDEDRDLCIVEETGTAAVEGLWSTFENLGGRFELRSTLLIPFIPAERSIYFDWLSGENRVRVFLVEAGMRDAVTVWACNSTDDDPFRFTTPTLETAIEGSPWPMAFEDVDGNGLRELCFYSSTRIFCLEESGEGILRERELFAPEQGEWIRSPSFANLDGDKKAELVIPIHDERHEHYALAVAEQDSDGRYREARRYSEEIISGVCVADFNGDGFGDVLPFRWSGNWSIYLGDGDGRLYRRPESYFFPITFPGAIAANLNGDMLSDLILAQPRMGLGLVSGSSPRGITRLKLRGNRLFDAGDLDADGDVDLVVGTTDGFEFLLNAGNGLLEPRPLITGIPDIVCAKVFDKGVAVLTEGATPTLTLLNTDGTPRGAHTMHSPMVPLLSAGDLDGDGIDELALISKTDFWVLWDGEELVQYPWLEGQLSLVDIISSPTLPGRLLLISTAEFADLYSIGFSGREIEAGSRLHRIPDAAPLALGHGDVDGDGADDPVLLAATFSVDEEDGGLHAIIASGTVLVAAGSELGVIVSEVSGFPEGDTVWPFSGMAVGDWNGDDIADIAFSLASGDGAYVLGGQGDGTSNSLNDLLVRAGPLVSADLDGNGTEELVCSTSGSGVYLWIRWNGGDT